MCCLVFSANGNNRSLVLLVALLMDKYRWTLRKTLEYIRAKDVFIGLSEHYIGQLEQLQDVLSQDKNNSPLSSSWKGPYLNEEEEIISKTFINSQEINYTKDEKKVPNNGKRVVWLDKLDKEKKREIKEGRPKLEDNFLEKRKVKRTDENSNGLGLGPSSFSAKIFKRDAIDLPLKRVENRKSKKQQGRNISNPKGGKTNEERDSLENQAEIN